MRPAPISAELSPSAPTSQRWGVSLVMAISLVVRWRPRFKAALSEALAALTPKRESFEEATIKNLGF
jgi:hypothetical protein